MGNGGLRCICDVTENPAEVKVMDINRFSINKLMGFAPKGAHTSTKDFKRLRQLLPIITSVEF
jgi:hypothetical protein